MNPEPCDHEIFQKGEGLCAIYGGKWAIETWVQKVAKISGQRVDWHYSSGIANVLFIGDYDKAMAAVNALEEELDGRILKRSPKNSHGLYRKGDELPEGTVAISAVENLIMADEKDGTIPSR